MQYCLKLGLIIEVNVQGTSKFTINCTAGSRIHGQGDMQVDVFGRLKL